MQNCESKHTNTAIANLQNVVEEHSRELCDSRTSIAVIKEQQTAMAHSVQQRIKAQSDEFWAALNAESAERKCCCEKTTMRLEWEAERRTEGDADVKAYADCSFVRNKKMLDPSQICPSVPTRIELLEEENAKMRRRLRHYCTSDNTNSSTSSDAV